MKLQVVYIDDEADLCAIFRDHFASPQVEIQTFSDPLQGLEHVKHNACDLLFTDYRMPQLTGEELVRKLDRALPVYLITGDINVIDSALFVQVLRKPFNVARIRQIIDAALKTRVGQLAE